MAVPKAPAASRTGAPSCWPQSLQPVHTRGRDRHWLHISHDIRQVSAGLINSRSEGKGGCWGATATQLRYVVPASPRLMTWTNITVVLSRWRLAMVHG